MADESTITITASRLVWRDHEIELWLHYDAGEWRLRSNKRMFRATIVNEIALTPAAMAALIEQWPTFEKTVEP